VVLTDGEAGTVEKLWLDEFHGLRNLDQGAMMGSGPSRPSNLRTSCLATVVRYPVSD
jgi:hypothetical protein